MKFYFDLDKERFVSAAGYEGLAGKQDFKLSAYQRLQVQFLRGADAVDLAGAAELRFGLKPDGVYDTDPIALADTDAWSKVEGETGVYEAVMSLNTAGIKAGLNVDEDDSNDLATMAAMGQMDWRNDPMDAWSKSPTLAVTVHNSVLQDTDGMEDDPVPEYPAAADVVAYTDQSALAKDDTAKAQARTNIGAAAQADVDALTASKDLEPMDTGRAYEVGEAFYWTDGNNYRCTTAAAMGETPDTDPAKFTRIGLMTDAEILAAVESESGRDMSADGGKLDALPFEVVEESGTTRTLTSDDRGRIIVCTNPAGCVITVNAYVMTAGAQVVFKQSSGAGQVTFTGDMPIGVYEDYSVATAGDNALVCLLFTEAVSATLVGQLELA